MTCLDFTTVVLCRFWPHKVSTLSLLAGKTPDTYVYSCPFGGVEISLRYSLQILKTLDCGCYEGSKSSPLKLIQYPCPKLKSACRL